MSHRWKRSQKPSRLNTGSVRKPKTTKTRRKPDSKKLRKKSWPQPKTPDPTPQIVFFDILSIEKKLETLEIPGRGKPFGKPDPRGKKKTLSKCVCAGTLSPCQPSSNLSFSLSDCQPLKGVGKKKTRPNLAPAFPAPLQPQVSGFAPLASTWPHQPNNFEIDGKDNTLSFSLVQKMQRVMLMKRFVHRPQNTWISQLSHIVFYGQLITKSAIKSFNKHKATQWHDQIS